MLPLREPTSSRPSTAVAATIAQTSRERGVSLPPSRRSRVRRAGRISRVEAATRATAPRKTQRQPTAWATYAASAGPKSDGRIHAAAKLAKTAGWRTAGKTRPIIT
jgi:hypothetical protein